MDAYASKKGMWEGENLEGEGQNQVVWKKSGMISDSQEKEQHSSTYNYSNQNHG